MTKDKLNELIEKAQKHIGKEIPVKKGEDNPNNKNEFIKHTFKSIGTICSFIDSGKESFEINGILEDSNKQIINTVSLWSIVNYFESQTTKNKEDKDINNTKIV